MPTTTTRPMHVPTTSPLTGNGAAAQDELLRVDNLQVHFPIVQGVCRRQVGTLRAVDGVSFSIKHGETLGLVGESGCGKSTTGRAILQLLKPTSGSVRLLGKELTSLSGENVRKMRREMSIGVSVVESPMGWVGPVETFEQVR